MDEIRLGRRLPNAASGHSLARESSFENVLF